MDLLDEEAVLILNRLGAFRQAEALNTRQWKRYEQQISPGRILGSVG